jgi:5'-3' exonuclease
MYQEGYEADDLIASICANATDECIVVTYDKDMLQLIKYPHVKIYNPQQKRMLDDEYVKEKYDIPSQHFDLYLALVGDAADNIKGVRNVGPKRASILINNTGGNIDSICSCIKVEKEYILSQLSLVHFLDCKVDFERRVVQKEDSFYDFLIKYEMT